MIIVAAHGPDFIGRCVDSIMRADRVGHNVLIQTQGSYDSGKYLTAVEHIHPEEDCIFLHDSTEITQPDFFVRAFAELGDRVRPLWIFHTQWGSKRDCEWGEGYIGSRTYPFGFFGPMFVTKARNMHAFREAFGMPLITNKQEQTLMEGSFCAGFTRLGIPIEPLFGDLDWIDINTGSRGIKKWRPIRD